MKGLLLFVLALITINCYSQKSFADFKYSGDTLYLGERKFIPGDTIHLGFGSGANKEFRYITQQTSDMSKYSPRNTFLPYEFVNSYLIFKRIDAVNKKSEGVQLNFVEPIFGTTPDNEHLEWMINFTYAIKSREIRL